MRFISHRGNTLQVNAAQENTVDYIFSALHNFDVEIDVWCIKNQLYLGHDEPQYPVLPEFFGTTLNGHFLWCHAKNIQALERLIKLKVTCFFHQTDDITPTIPHHYLWTFPGKPLLETSICVMPEVAGQSPEQLFTQKLAGVCSDKIQEYQDYFLNFKK